MTLRRYERRHEAKAATIEIAADEVIPFDRASAALEHSALSAGSRTLLLGLLRTGTTRVFPGGGVGIEYGSLLKTAVRPDVLRGHIEEAVEHLRERRVDLLLVPGMSGYPVGAMYAYAADLPAVLLKKQKHALDSAYPTGSFVIPSYTGDGDVVMSADLDAVADIVAGIVERQIAEQTGRERVEIAIRCAGSDDIIDKAVMAHAITECAPLYLQAALDGVVGRHRARTGDARPFDCRAEVVAWVTPLIKSYSGSAEHLTRTFGIEPFAGVSIASVHLDPPALGIADAGTFQFADR
ncbi:MAG: hypothetical protein IT336_16055 [Thermomicrobiales bacterium]|nr:hypothetical protein [Thermomicrobiales bacterium]